MSKVISGVIGAANIVMAGVGVDSIRHTRRMRKAGLITRREAVVDYTVQTALSAASAAVGVALICDALRSE